jgi:endonuclease/exonuclease/phosphatase family metal-dependent hydrolase
VESVHPAAPYALGVLDDWRADLAAQPAAAQPGPVQDGPVQDGSIQDGPVRDGPIRVLAGDFNATLDHALLRRLLATGYRDAAATVGAGLAGTWPACARSWGSLRSFLAGRVDALPCRPVPPVVIDHVLADRRVGIVAVSVHRLPGSDHRAVLAVLSLPGPS